MNLEIKKNAETVVIGISGRIDTNTAPALEAAISTELGDIRNLVLDIKDVEYISSAGLRVLLSTQKKLQKSGGMKVINVCPEVMDVFEITGFADILSIE